MRRDESNIAVLARDVCGHLVPQLVLARALGNLGNKVSGIGAAVIVCKDREAGGIDYAVSTLLDWQPGRFSTFCEKPSTWLIVPMLIIRDDRWDECWIELVDRDGYVAMDVARHNLGCEINGHWFGEPDEAGVRRCTKCGTPASDVRRRCAACTEPATFWCVNSGGAEFVTCRQHRSSCCRPIDDAGTT